MTAADAVLSCPVCADPLEGAARRDCPRCETPHHRECWDYVGDCAIFGCREGAAVPAVQASGSTSVTAGGGLGWLGSVMWIWGWVFRTHWWCLLIMATALAFAFPAPFLPGPLQLPVFLGMTAAALATGVYLVLSLPLILLTEVVGRQVQFQRRPTKEGLRPALDRLELRDDESWLAWGMRALPWVYGGTWLLALLHQGAWWLARGARVPVEMALGMLVSAAVCAGLGSVTLAALRAATRERMVFATTVQNRLIASSKVRGLLPPGRG